MFKKMGINVIYVYRTPTRAIAKIKKSDHHILNLTSEKKFKFTNVAINQDVIYYLSNSM